MIEATQTGIHQTPIQIFRRFLRFGLLAFGGPVAQIAMLKQELVEEEKWVTREEFNRALAVYQILPGPEAHEMCVWFGMIAGGRLGGFLAGLGFMLPGFLLMLCLTWIYFTFGIEHPALQSLFIGFNVAVIALIFNAVKRISQHALTAKELWIIAILAAGASFLGISFIIILLVLGLAYAFYMKSQKAAGAFITVLLLAYSVYHYFQKESPVQENIIATASRENEKPLAVFITGLKAGLLTFGGAYTSIPFVEKDAVQKYHWVSEEQFLDGLALSGVLPAPLIIFSTFAGYAANGFLGALLITIGIFLPAFAFTLLGHNFFQRVVQNTSLHHFLDGVTAGVIGIISMTAIKLFVSTITDWISALLFLGSLVYLLRIKSRFSPIIVILISGGVMWVVMNIV